jgi:predicted GH43/DUF377 family glycosyl hydrolase
LNLWHVFGPDYRRNCLAWQHSPRNPVIPATGHTWKRFWTANPDVLGFAGKRLLYYRGNGILPSTDGRRHDRIGVAEITGIASDQLELQELAGGLPVVDVGLKGAFDAEHVLDPAATVFQGKIWLYYSGIGGGPDSIGLATSPDGVHFEKVGRVLEGRAPDVVVKGKGISMLYQKKNPDGRYEFYLAHAEDGIHFEDIMKRAVFSPAEGHAWDNFDVSTGRLYPVDDEYLLLYGASSYLVDQPEYFGLARSTDLIHWARHPGNPIFGCGPKGAEDGGAIWFPALIETEARFVLLYEGSRGNYRGDLSSQICMASLPKTYLLDKDGEPQSR